MRISDWSSDVCSSDLTTPNDAILMNEEGNEVYLDKPAVIEAAQFWNDLSAKHGVMPRGTVDWGTTPKDFLEKKAAIVWTTTGNLTNIRKNADFPFGVAMMPKAKRGGSPTGGGRSEEHTSELQSLMRIP